jgi:4-hydroxybenzoate polyprenyltransferase and related prenyltransferases
MSSILVAFSGVSRVYVASLLLQTSPGLLTCLAGGLIIYSVYTLDRALDSKEDSINRKELDGSRKDIGLVTSLLTFLIGSYIFTQNGILALAFFPIITGFLYSKGIKIGRFALKLKGGLGVKNVVVGITWGLCTVGAACSNYGKIVPIILVFTLYGVKTFINSILDDFKDIEGDIQAGIKTLPIYIGEIKTRSFLLKLHIFSHLILIIALLIGLIDFEPLIIICSFVCGLICIQSYAKKGNGSVWKSVFKDGEAGITIILTGIANTFLI